MPAGRVVEGDLERLGHRRCRPGGRDRCRRRRATARRGRRPRGRGARAAPTTSWRPKSAASSKAPGAVSPPVSQIAGRVAADRAEAPGVQAGDVVGAVTAHRDAADRDAARVGVQLADRPRDHLVDDVVAPAAVAAVVPVGVVAAVGEDHGRARAGRAAASAARNAPLTLDSGPAPLPWRKTSSGDGLRAAAPAATGDLGQRATDELGVDRVALDRRLRWACEVPLCTFLRRSRRRAARPRPRGPRRRLTGSRSGPEVRRRAGRRRRRRPPRRARAGTAASSPPEVIGSQRSGGSRRRRRTPRRVLGVAALAAGDPVAVRRAAPRRRAAPARRRRRVVRGQAAGQRELVQVAEQPEAGHVGQRVGARRARGAGGVAVGLAHHGDRGVEVGAVAAPRLVAVVHRARAERLGEDERVARLVRRRS